MDFSVRRSSPPNTYSYVQEENLCLTRKFVEIHLLFYQPNSCTTSLIAIYLHERKIYSILRTIVPGPKPPLANQLLDMFGVNHGAERLWPLPWPMMLVHPNQALRHHTHTMGDVACAQFRRSPWGCEHCAPPHTAFYRELCDRHNIMGNLGVYWHKGVG